jgi:hypothetical protein
MVFHGKQYPGGKKTKIGRQPRRATSEQAYQAAQEAARAAGVQEDHEPVAPHVDPPPPKKQRPDDNWRVARAVRSRDQTLQRMSSQKADLSNRIDSLQKSLANQKTAVKCLKHAQHVDAKEHRTASLNLEEAHKRAIANLLEEHAVTIDDAFAKADIETEKLLLLEQHRLEAEAGYIAKIREERQLANDKLEKERRSHKATSLDWHARWIKNMARNMKDHKRDTAKLEKKFKKTLDKERIENQSR